MDEVRYRIYISAGGPGSGRHPGFGNGLSHPHKTLQSLLNLANHPSSKNTPEGKLAGEKAKKLAQSLGVSLPGRSQTKSFGDVLKSGGFTYHGKSDDHGGRDKYINHSTGHRIYVNPQSSNWSHKSSQWSGGDYKTIKRGKGVDDLRQHVEHFRDTGKWA